MQPAEYLAKTYYEIWIAGLEKLLAERGLVTPDEVAAGKSLHAPKDSPAILTADRVAMALSKGGPTTRPATAPQRFQVGDRVRARNMHPAGHTRLPRYVRGHAGTITHVHGVHVLPDANSTGRGEDPQWLYTVRFTARELWGEAADPTSSVSVDAWESYLEPQ
jgi:nitrile hydratase subunit beta